MQPVLIDSATAATALHRSPDSATASRWRSHERSASSSSSHTRVNRPFAPLGVCPITISIAPPLRRPGIARYRPPHPRRSWFGHRAHNAFGLAERERSSSTIRSAALPGSAPAQRRAAPARGPSRGDVRRPAAAPSNRGSADAKCSTSPPGAPECVGHVFVRDVELLDETHERPRLVNRLEILAPMVLAARYRDRLPIAQIAHDCGDPHNPLYPCRPQTTRTGHQLVPTGARSPPGAARRWAVSPLVEQRGARNPPALSRHWSTAATTPSCAGTVPGLRRVASCAYALIRLHAYRLMRAYGYAVRRS